MNFKGSSRFLAAAALCLALASCMSNASESDLKTFAGAIAGALAGSALTGNVAGAIAGFAIGGMAGYELGKDTR